MLQGNKGFWADHGVRVWVSGASNEKVTAFDSREIIKDLQSLLPGSAQQTLPVAILIENLIKKYSEK